MNRIAEIRVDGLGAGNGVLQRICRTRKGMIFVTASLPWWKTAFTFRRRLGTVENGWFITSLRVHFDSICKLKTDTRPGEGYVQFKCYCRPPGFTCATY